MQERSRRIGAVPTKQCDVENQLRIDVDCSIQLRLLGIYFDCGLVNGDPRPLRRPQNSYISDELWEDLDLSIVGGPHTLSASRGTQFQTAP
jgi:hypothetical protein